MRYVVFENTGVVVFIEEFETLGGANNYAWGLYRRNRFDPSYRFNKNLHVFVAMSVDGDGLVFEDNYFDSKTFYMPIEERCFDDLWYEVQETVRDNDNLDFVLDEGRFIFSVPWYVIEEYYIEERDEFDKIGSQIIYAFYKKAVREKIDEVLSFYELA